MNTRGYSPAILPCGVSDKYGLEGIPSKSSGRVICAVFRTPRAQSSCTVGSRHPLHRPSGRDLDPGDRLERLVSVRQRGLGRVVPRWRRVEGTGRSRPDTVRALEKWVEQHANHEKYDGRDELWLNPASESREFEDVGPVFREL